MVKYQKFSTLFYLLSVGVMLFACLRMAGGSLFYSLDDPYIHLAVAENILRGGYGVNLQEYSSPCSSILWPFLLTVPLWMGLGVWGPLLLGVGANVASVWLVSGFVWRHVFGAEALPSHRWLMWVTAPLTVLSINAVALPFTGMEHPLHILGVVMVLCGLERLVLSGKVTALLALGIVLSPLVRFEGLALSLAALGAVLASGHAKKALGMSGVLLWLLAAYAHFMTSRGLPIMPSSVLVKSGVTANAADGRALHSLAGVVFNVVRAVSEHWGGLLLLVVACLALASWRGPWRPQPAHPWLVLPALAAVVAHLMFGQYGWFGRYEVYVVAIALMALAFAHSSTLRDPRYFAAKAWVVTTVLVLMSSEYLLISFKTPLASRNIHQQQYQMHRFATEYLPKPVAVNDLGWVAFRNDQYVLDLWGLGSEEARLMARQGGRTPAAMAELVRRHQVGYAMLYDEWFVGAIPASWCKVAVLHTSSVTSGSDKVAFYATEASIRPELGSALKRFQPTLPEGARLEWVAGCNPP